MRDPRDPYALDTMPILPTRTYTMTTATFAIPCARYPIEGGWARHLCAVPGPRYTCSGCDKYDYDYAVELSVDPRLEADLEPIWQLLVAGFVAEQQK